MVVPAHFSFTHGLLQGSRTGMRMLFPAGTAHSPWERAHFSNNKCTQDTPCSNNNFLKNEVSLPKVLESCSNDPISCCAVLASRGAHRMQGLKLLFWFYSVVHGLWRCCYVLSLHRSWGHSHMDFPELSSCPACSGALPPSLPSPNQPHLHGCVLMLLPFSWSPSIP